MKEDKGSALDEFTVHELLKNIRLVLEKTRGEAISANKRSNENKKEINELILAMDKIFTSLTNRLQTIENKVEQQQSQGPFSWILSKFKTSLKNKKKS